MYQSEIMEKSYSMTKRVPIGLLVLVALSSLPGCVQATVPTPPPPPTTSTENPTENPTESPQPTLYQSPTPTEIIPQTIVFYGDSSLAIGDAGDGINHSGFSFVTNLEMLMTPSYTLVTANYGGRYAKWAYEHLSEFVLPYQPDLVTLWWGFDDMGGCPGTFDRNTNQLILSSTERRIEDHILYLGLLIDTLLGANIPVFVMTPIPARGGNLSWSHLDENYNIVWEDTWCHFNEGLELLAQAQRDLVAHYSTNGAPVRLVDVWQIYMDHPNAEKMYMDVVHPGSNAAQLIAEGWLEVFEESQR